VAQHFYGGPRPVFGYTNTSMPLFVLPPDVTYTLAGPRLNEPRSSFSLFPCSQLFTLPCPITKRPWEHLLVQRHSCAHPRLHGPGNSEYDFFLAGTSHPERKCWCGFHFANHHVAPGKKLWTWGNRRTRMPWDRKTSPMLTGHTSKKLNASVFLTDHHSPDFSWLFSIRKPVLEVHSGIRFSRSAPAELQPIRPQSRWKPNG